MIRALLKVFKWLLVGVGSVAAILVVVSLLWTRYGYKVAATHAAVIGDRWNPCQFSYEVPIGFWTPDTQTGTDALVRTWNRDPLVYLYAERSLKPRFPGDWFISGHGFDCTITPRAIVQGKQGATIPTFLANRCQIPPDALAQFKGANVLYAQVPVGDGVHVIAFTSRSEKDLMKLEPEFRQLVATHYAPKNEAEKAACARKMK